MSIVSRYESDSWTWRGKQSVGGCRRPSHGRRYDRSSFYLTMRDGVRIAVDLYLPRSLSAKDCLPAILTQARYHRRTLVRYPFSLIRDRFGVLHSRVSRIVSSEYAYIVADVRGTGASFGSRTAEWSMDEVQDGVEIVDWITRQQWSNGRVGLTGTSYLGTAAEMLLTQRHPSVRAADIRFVAFDVYAQILCPGGARNRHFLEGWSSFTSALDRNDVINQRGIKGALCRMAIGGVAPVDEDSCHELLLAAIGSHGQNYDMLATALSITFRDDVPPTGICVDAISPHALVDDLKASNAAICTWAGYYDGANAAGALQRHLNLPPSRHRLILGPWDHGAFNYASPFARRPGASRLDHTGELLHFFEIYLKPSSQLGLCGPTVHYFTTGQERWKAAVSWPPPGTKRTALYFCEGHSLVADMPQCDNGSDRYRVDPRATSGVHSRWRSLLNRGDRTVDYSDRQEQDKRLLVYESQPLTRALEVTGHPTVNLWVRSTATDGLFFVYLEDVCPSGTVRYVTEGVLRAIHRHTASAPSTYRMPDGVPYRSFLRRDASLLVPGEPAQLIFDLLPISHQFDTKHRIRVAISGADHDNFEFVPGIPPDIEILRNREHASSISLPILPASSEVVPSAMSRRPTSC